MINLWYYPIKCFYF